MRSHPPIPPRVVRASFVRASLVALIASLLAGLIDVHAENAAYVHVLKRETSDTRFHLGELEAFAKGVVPNNAGGASFGGMTTSTNDIGANGTYGDGNSHPVIGTTTNLEHGGANKNPNNQLESGGAVWSTGNGIGSNAQYTLDLGGTHDVTTIRLWPRADGCCSNRWRNLEIQLLDANRDPVPGTLNLHTTDTGNDPLEFTFADASSINSFTVSPETASSGTAVTLSWNFDAAATAASIDQGVGNVMPQTANGVGSLLLDPGPQNTTTYTLSVTKGGEVSTAQVTVAIDNNPIIRFFTGQHPSVAPGTSMTLDWDVDNATELLLDGVDVTGLTSISVSPLATTTYTLTANNALGSSLAQVTVEVVDVPNFVGAAARFVEIVKNDVGTRLHLSEIEVFQFGVTPNDGHADGTSGNDLVQAGNPSPQTPPTTTQLEHGLAASVYDGNLESGADTWTTVAGLGSAARYMLDLGATESVGVVRLFGREDACCLDRLQNVTVNTYDDDGSGNPGTLISTATFPGTAPAGSAGHIELDLAVADPGIRNFAVDRNFIPTGEPITLTWVVNTATTSVTIDPGVGDVTGLTDAEGVGSIALNPGPSASTVYTLTAERPSGTSASSLSVAVTDQPLIYSFTGDASIVAPGTQVNLAWDVASVTALTLNGANVTGTTGIAVTPNATTTYTLIASNSNGTTAQEVRVQVVIPGEPVISELMSDNESGLLDEDGEPSDWIEICNPTGTTAQLNGYYLTDDPNNLTKWRFPNVTLGGGRYLVVFATGNDRAVSGSELHTNFSLDRVGEYVALVKPDGTTILNEFAPYPPQRADVSYGFDVQTLREGYFVTPTPGATNAGSFTDFVADTKFSVGRGFYTDPIEVVISSATPGAQIRYTLNGTKPTENTGLVYSTPIGIPRTAVLRAAAFKAGFVPTNVDTQTYIFPSDVISHPNMRTGITQDPTYGPQMEASLQAVPTVSLVFQGDVERSEKEASVEFINFEGGDTQVDAGMERFGNYVTNFAKRSMRLNFRSQYGPRKLTFPVFDGHDYPIPVAARFDSIDLRSGNHDMNQRGAYLSNRFIDDTMMDMGQIAPHGRFVHVYLNGLYWGQYHMRERWNADMLAEYFGGSGGDYEAINANNSGDEFLTGTPYDGIGQYWNETRSRIAGPTPFANSRSHLDIPNVTDFMLLWVSGNSESEFRSAGGVPIGVPFKFFMKDGDGFLRSPGRSVTHNGPINAMTELRSEGDPDYRILVADRIHKHYFNDGAFTPAKNIARLTARMNESQLSFYSEAARWDFRTPSSWQSYQDNLISNHFPGLTNTMIGRFQSAGMYPTTVAPTFSQHGGGVPEGFRLQMAAPAGTIYYTLDGTDPRVSAGPINNDPPVVLVTESAAKRVHIPANANDGFTDGGGNDWKEPGYDDAAWTPGSGGVGYDSGAGDRYRPHIGIDVEAVMDDLRTSCLIRIPFTPAAGALTGMTSAELRVRYDDGYVAYLNGVEIGRQNFVGAPDGDSNASASHGDAEAELLQSIDISAHLGLITEGQENILAIHGLNLSTGSSDFLISADLRVSSSGGGGPSGGISPTAIAYTGSFPIDTVTEVRARVRTGSAWSALNEATFVPIQDFSGLVVSEFMYNPSPATAAEIAAGHSDSEDFEYFELLNTGAETLDLTGLRVTDGIAFDFTGSDITSLAAGQRVLIVEDREAFAFRYGSGLPIAGQYTGKLKDEGETVQIVDALDLPVRLFTYDNMPPWPTEAAGRGSSLVLFNPNSVPDHNLAANWRASIPGGTPGRADVRPFPYTAWATSNGIADPNEDLDLDGLSNFLEFVLLSDPRVGSSLDGKVIVEVQTLDLGSGPDEYLTLTIIHRIAATEVDVTPEVSGDLIFWDDGLGSAALHRRIYHGDGTATSVYRTVDPISAALRGFIRVRFEIP